VQTHKHNDLGHYADGEYVRWGLGAHRYIQGGIRPTFSWSLPGGFWADCRPTISTRGMVGFGWFTAPPSGGRAIYVPGKSPVNVIIAQAPFLVETPVPFAPHLSMPGFSREDWNRIGVDPDQQNFLWTMPDGGTVETSASISFASRIKLQSPDGPTEYLGHLQNGQSAASGVHVQGEMDFLAIYTHFGCVAHTGHTLPPGTYRFRVEAYAIPHELAYEGQNADRIVNKHLKDITDPVKWVWEVTGVIPPDLKAPNVKGIHPHSASVGDVVTIHGRHLKNTQEIVFAGDVNGLISEVTDEAIGVVVQSGAVSGSLVVKTPLGWVRTSDELTVTGSVVEKYFL
jgi:hypothetical protein